MCEATYYKHTGCQCRWAQITTQCLPGLGFSNCPDYGAGRVHAAPRYTLTNSPRCPVHDLLGLYDRNAVRMVVRVRNGVKWGSGPGVGDVGVECPCVVM